MRIICLALTIYWLLIILRIAVSFFPVSPGTALESAARGLSSVTEPVLGPVRRVLPPARLGGMGLDLSPLIVLLSISVLQAVIC